MIRRLVLLLLFCSAPLLAQEVATYGETVEVRIGNVDVVVTDRRGNHVEGLTRDDFEIFENGKPQAISNFYEVRQHGGQMAPSPSQPGAPSSAADEGEKRRRRNFVFFVDTYSLAPHRRNEALTALRRFAKENLGDGDQAMLAVFDRRLRVIHPLSTDVRIVDADIEKLFRTSGGTFSDDQSIARLRIVASFEQSILAAQSGMANIRLGYNSALDVARDFAMEQRKISENLGIALQDTFRSVAGVEGKKVVVLVGENFPTYPGIAMYQFVNDTFERYGTQVQMVVPQVVAAKNTLAAETEQVTRAANANEVTVHSIYSGNDNIDDPSYSARQSTPASRYLEFSDSGGTMAGLSRDTGGIAVVGSRSFERAADAITHDLDSYYSLAYRLDVAVKGERRIEVRMKDKNLGTRTRRALVGKTLDEEIADHASGRLFQDRPSEEDRVEVRAGTPAKERGKKIRVPIGVSFPSSLLTLLEQEGRKAGGFDIVVATTDDEHRLSEISRQHQEVSWLAAGVPPTINYNVDVIVRDRPGRISVAVVDRWTKTPFYGIAVLKK